jgi:hypothetical protein
LARLDGKDWQAAPTGGDLAMTYGRPETIALGMNKSAVSHQLRTLWAIRLVSRRDGMWFTSDKIIMSWTFVRPSLNIWIKRQPEILCDF